MAERRRDGGESLLLKGCKVKRSDVGGGGIA